MYIDYSKLWKLLIDKQMNKTDLLILTGLSSRVLAKLSKNEIVTTDTIAKICSALNCDVSDIMECVSDEKRSLYNHYRANGKIVEKNELYTVKSFVANNQKYTIYISNKTANKYVNIHCQKDGCVYWEQVYPLGFFPARENTVLIKPKRSKDEIVIVLIKGNPAVITGLDEGRFVSCKKKLQTDSDVYVMSEAAFKLF